MLIGLALMIAQPQTVSAAPRIEQPVEAERLAIASDVAAAMVPAGSLARQMQARFQRFDRVGGGRDLGPPPTDPQLRAIYDKISQMPPDPAYAERMRISKRILDQAGVQAATEMEPLYREAMAKSLARRLTAVQLREVLAFMGTNSGGVFAGQLMDAFGGPELEELSGTMTTIAMRRMAEANREIEKATAHLPSPRGPAGTPAAKP